MLCLPLADIYISVPLYKYGPDIVPTKNGIQGTWVLNYHIGLDLCIERPIRDDCDSTMGPREQPEVVEFQAQVLKWNSLPCIWLKRKIKNLFSIRVRVGN